MRCSGMSWRANWLIWYACQRCDSYQETLALLGDRKFDLLLADVSMPGANGHAILKEALRLSPNIAVILLTSVVDIEMVGIR